MAKSFIYPNANLLTATIVDGGIDDSGGTPWDFAAGTPVTTNPERINDMSIKTAISGFSAVGGGDDDGCLQIDLGSAQSCDVLAIYLDAADTDDISLYGNSSNTQAGNLIGSINTFSEGWTILSFNAASYRYWYIQALVGTINIKEIILGNKYDFALSPDFGDVVGKQFANDIIISYGGDEYSKKRHDGKKIWTISWHNIPSTMQVALEAVRDAVEGDYKKFIYYDETSYYWVRASADSFQFKEISSGRHSGSAKLRQQLS